MMLSNSLLCVLRSGSDYHQYRVLRTAASSGGGTRLENATAQVKLVMMITFRFHYRTKRMYIRTI